MTVVVNEMDLVPAEAMLPLAGPQPDSADRPSEEQQERLVERVSQVRAERARRLKAY